MSVTGNTGGGDLNGSSIVGPLTVRGDAGTMPSPDSGPVHAAGNVVVGSVRIQP